MRPTGLTITTAVLCFCSVKAFQSHSSNYLGRLYRIQHVTHRLWPVKLEDDNNTPSEVEAATLSDYLVKAHEDKLRAVADVDRKRKEEIAALKVEIADLKSRLSTFTNSDSTTVQSGTHFGSMSKEQLIGVAEQYQKFLSDYVVKVSLDKYRAVKVAEAALNQKWEARLKAMTTEPPLPSPVDTSGSPQGGNNIDMLQTSAVSHQDFSLYEARNARIRSAAAAGKSRWVDKEIQRDNIPIAIKPSPVSLLPSNVATGSNGLYDLRNNALIGASTAGKSRWSAMEVEKVISSRIKVNGSVGDFSRKSPSPVFLGSDSNGMSALDKADVKEVFLSTTYTAVNGAETPVHADFGSLLGKPQEDLFHHRNIAVLAADGAGKSRWIKAEVDKSRMAIETDSITGNELSSLGYSHANGVEVRTESKVVHAKESVTNLFTLRNVAVVESEAAGKSRWGKLEVDKARHSSLDVAVNGDESHKLNTILPRSSDTTLHSLRNAVVVASEAAGKSRWGRAEVEKALLYKENAPHNGATSPLVPRFEIAIPPEVIAADHGLRSNGDVGGPSLAERVADGALTGGANARVNGVDLRTEPNGLIPVQVQASATTLFTLRNAAVVASEKAGKSRWGKLEIEKAKSTALHVGVNGHESHTSGTTDTKLYSLRNGAIAEAGGKSRWGSAEVEKAYVSTEKTPLNGSTSPHTSRAEVPVPPEVIAADHGLRSAGDVGGPTLADRVAYGALASAALASFIWNPYRIGHQL